MTDILATINGSFFEKYGSLDVLVVSAEAVKVTRGFESHFGALSTRTTRFHQSTKVDQAHKLIDAQQPPNMVITDYGLPNAEILPPKQLDELVEKCNEKLIKTIGVNADNALASFGAKIITGSSLKIRAQDRRGDKLDEMEHLVNYQPKLYVFLGETCSGKTTSSRYFLQLSAQNQQIINSKTLTTRKQRHWETLEEYEFLSDEEFDREISDPDKDWALYRYSQSEDSPRYAVDLAQIRTALTAGHDAVLVGNLNILPKLLEKLGDRVVPIKVGASRDQTVAQTILRRRLTDRFFEHRGQGGIPNAEGEFQMRLKQLPDQLDLFWQNRHRFRYFIETANDDNGPRCVVEIGSLLRRIRWVESKLYRYPADHGTFHEEYIGAASLSLFGHSRPPNGGRIIVPKEYRDKLPWEQLEILESAKVRSIEEEHPQLRVVLDKPPKIYGEGKHSMIGRTRQHGIVLSYLQQRLEQECYMPPEFVPQPIEDRQLSLALTHPRIMTKKDTPRLTELVISY